MRRPTIKQHTHTHKKQFIFFLKSWQKNLINGIKKQCPPFYTCLTPRAPIPAPQKTSQFFLTLFLLVAFCVRRFIYYYTFFNISMLTTNNNKILCIVKRRKKSPSSCSPIKKKQKKRKMKNEKQQQPTTTIARESSIFLCWTTKQQEEKYKYKKNTMAIKIANNENNIWGVYFSFDGGSFFL